MHTRFTPLRTAAALLASMLLLATSAVSAHASIPTSVATSDDPGSSSALVQCLGTESITYDPGLTTTLQDVEFFAQGTLGPCVSLLGPDFAGAQITFDGGGDLSCLEGGNSSGIGTISWNGGQESEFTFTGSVSLRPLGVTVLVLTGTVTNGAFEGSGVVQTITLATLDLLSCLTPQGMTSTSGPITVNINPLT